MKTMIVTGGTGFVGAFLAAELVRQGCRVIFLTRRKRGFSSAERVRRILGFAAPELDNTFERSCTVVESDITGTGLDISPDSFSRIRALKPEALFHCAGSVDFDEKNRQSTMLTNVKGTASVCDLAGALGVRRFHHMSTLYVAGTRTGRISEKDFSLRGPFNNAYEESKARAEDVVRRWSIRTGIPYVIYRLPIVLGDSLTGKALSFTGFYGFFKPFWLVAQMARGGQSSLYVRCGLESTIDLVPIDWAAKTILLAGSKDVEGSTTLHLTYDRPSSFLQVARESLGHLGMRDVILGPGTASAPLKQPNRVLERYQRSIDVMVSQFLPYATSTKRFSNEGLARLIGRDFMGPPPVDAAFLSRMLDYAVRVAFSPPTFV